MELNTVLAWLVAYLVAANGGVLIVVGWAMVRVLRMMMFFHNTGRSLAQFELQKAELEVRKVEAEAQMKRAEVEAVSRVARHGKFGSGASRVSEEAGNG